MTRTGVVATQRGVYKVCFSQTSATIMSLYSMELGECAAIGEPLTIMHNLHLRQMRHNFRRWKDVSLPQVLFDLSS